MKPKKEAKSEELSHNLAQIQQVDETDRKIFNFLNKDGRATLKEIAKEVGVSIDTVKRRIEKMKETGAIMKIIAIPNPLFFGYSLYGHVYVKYHNFTEEKNKAFENYLKFHNQVTITIPMIGEYDMYFVVMTKNTQDMTKIKNEVRAKFSDFISDWKEIIVSEVGKYEEYKF